MGDKFSRREFVALGTASIGTSTLAGSPAEARAATRTMDASFIGPICTIDASASGERSSLTRIDNEASLFEQLESARSQGIGVLLANLGHDERPDPIRRNLGRLERLLHTVNCGTLASETSALSEAATGRRIAVMACIGAAPLYRGSVFDVELEELADLRSAGIGIMGLVHDWRGLCGDGALEQSDSPLTALGVSTVKLMNRARIVIDLARCGRSASLEAMAVSEQPVIFSRAGAMAVEEHPAHLSDEQIAACAAGGGIVAVAPETSASDVTESFMRHLDHVLDVAGIDHVALATMTVDPVREHLWARDCTAGEMAQVMGGNFRRLFEQVWS